MEARVRVSILFTVLLLLATSYSGASSSFHGVGNDRRISSGGPGRNFLGLQRNSQIPNCREMDSRSQCLQRSKCRWCRSDAIDDMCFSSSEAWRLPQQICWNKERESYLPPELAQTLKAVTNNSRFLQESCLKVVQTSLHLEHQNPGP